MKYGLIPEFIGRLPVVTTVDDLDKEQMIQGPARAEERPHQAVRQVLRDGRGRAGLHRRRPRRRRRPGPLAGHRSPRPPGHPRGDEPHLRTVRGRGPLVRPLGAAGIFRPEYRPDGEPFCVVIPPPNVTGSLHMGHALNHTIQDVIIRRKRMQGYAALWLPGTDHAGIATQNVVERELARRASPDTTWAGRPSSSRCGSGSAVRRPHHRADPSHGLFDCDWSRERFTMDEGLSQAVREVFVDLYDENLIYRGNRIINWCPRCRTALSRHRGGARGRVRAADPHRYPFTDGPAAIEVATTRPETMLGDTGVAVHPDDERYADAVGRTVDLPLIGREIPIVADDAVDPEFGTGAVKVTPAHDPLDFEIAASGTAWSRSWCSMSGAIVTDRRGVRRDGPFEAGRGHGGARGEGALWSVEQHQHSVGHCYRCSTVVEPYLSDQWFVAVTDLARPAIEAVRTAATVHPKRWEKTLLPLDGEPAGLDHQPPDLVGSPDSCLVLPPDGRSRSMVDPPGVCRVRLGPAPGRGRARHLVLVGAVPVLDARLARGPTTSPVLSERGADHRLRHHLLLGGPHDEDGSPLHGRSAVPRHHPRAGARRRRPQDVQVPGQHHRSARRRRGVRGRPAPAGPDPGRQPRPGRAPRHGVGGRCPPLRQQAVERRLVSCCVTSKPGRCPPRRISGGPGSGDAWILARLGEVAARFDALCDQYRFSDAFGCSTASPGARCSTGTWRWRRRLSRTPGPRPPGRPSEWCCATCSSSSTRPSPT
jgi:hypothetical protein